jgi:RHS repeat-associated protein
MVTGRRAVSVWSSSDPRRLWRTVSACVLSNRDLIQGTSETFSLCGVPLAHTYLGDPDIMVESENDRLGSARRIRETDTLFALGQSELGPYGETYDATGVSPFFTYTGHPVLSYSDYNLYYAPYRMYSPDSARWTTRDPEGMIDGPNVYVYVDNDPTGWYDPSGLSIVGDYRNRILNELNDQNWENQRRFEEQRNKNQDVCDIPDNSDECKTLAETIAKGGVKGQIALVLWVLNCATSIP